MILLVEDDPDHVELALLALGQHNLADRVVVAQDGAEALDCLSRDPLPRFVLLDLKLPKVHGLEVLRRIREHRRTQLLPVVVLSSSDEETHVIRSYQLMANIYIVKPVDFNTFSEAARQIGAYWLTLNHVPISNKNDFRNVVPRFTPENREANQAVVALVSEFAKQKRVTPAQIALLWILAQKPWMVIPGTTKVHRLEENLGALDVELTPEDVRKLNEASAKISLQGERYPETC